MTNEEKYTHILLAMGELLKQKEDRLFILEYEVKSLREQLKAAEMLVEASEAKLKMMEEGANHAELV